MWRVGLPALVSPVAEPEVDSGVAPTHQVTLPRLRRERGFFVRNPDYGFALTSIARRRRIDHSRL